MIPKKIFYCWFGRRELPQLYKACIDSWKLYCPDYEIIEINEDNFNIKPYQEMYDKKLYAFLSDIARLEFLQKYQGFYLDTDIKLIKSLDSLLSYDGIIGSSGKGWYNNCPLACAKPLPLFDEWRKEISVGNALKSLNELLYKKYNMVGTQLQIFDNIAILGTDYFTTPTYTANSKTIGIHYCGGSWLDAKLDDFDVFSDFLGFEVYQDGVRDTVVEKRLFADTPKIGTINTINSPMYDLWKSYGNYFFNPRVQRVVSNKFVFERYNAKPINNSYITEGLIIQTE